MGRFAERALSLRRCHELCYFSTETSQPQLVTGRISPRQPERPMRKLWKQNIALRHRLGVSKTVSKPR
jgi:hypothetical protein